MKQALWLVGMLLAGSAIAGLLGGGQMAAGLAAPASEDSREGAALEEMRLLYSFSGVSDDGDQGGGDAQEATSVHCTNLGVDPVHVEVQLFNYDGSVYTATITVDPDHTATFSTQATAIFFDDVLIGGASGTPAIYQGHGRVLANGWSVICTAHVLDPQSYPPQYLDRLPLYDRHGDLVKRHIAGPDMMFIPLVGK
jgi:hypothetical protein